MKRRRLHLGWFFACVVLCFSVYYLLADGKMEIQIAEKRSFFQKPTAFVLEKLAPYAKMPDCKDVLPPDSYGQVVKQFNWWLNKVLKPEYVPDKTFVEKNINLAPANNNDRKEDIAFLSYKIEDKTYMIVQTGGHGAHMLVFVDDPAKVKIRDTDEGLISANDFLDKFINEDIRKRIPLLEVKKTEDIYLAEVKASESHREIINTNFYMREGETCLFIRKRSDTVPAREPMPNEWFSWWKNK